MFLQKRFKKPGHISFSLPLFFNYLLHHSITDGMTTQETDTLPFIDKLKNKIKGEVLSDDYSLGMYSTDASFYQIRPLAVVLPMDNEDVKKDC